MTDAAKILSSLSPRSLLVIDEIGRGTSTFDGMSLAQAILEHLLRQKKGLTFFATHFHELTALEIEFPNLLNGHLAISDSQGTSEDSMAAGIKFLYQLVKGPAGKSYGVEVAKLAGLPQQVTRRAEQILANLEKPNHPTSTLGLRLLTNQMPLFVESDLSSRVQPSLSEIAPSSRPQSVLDSSEATVREVLAEINSWDCLTQPPLESLRKLQEWKSKLAQAQVAKNFLNL
jgi:DNA mismatch repair protein MutS